MKSSSKLNQNKDYYQSRMLSRRIARTGRKTKRSNCCDLEVCKVNTNSKIRSGSVAEIRKHVAVKMRSHLKKLKVKVGPSYVSFLVPKKQYLLKRIKVNGPASYGQLWLTTDGKLVHDDGIVWGQINQFDIKLKRLSENVSVQKTLERNKLKNKTKVRKETDPNSRLKARRLSEPNTSRRLSSRLLNRNQNMKIETEVSANGNADSSQNVSTEVADAKKNSDEGEQLSSKFVDNATGDNSEVRDDEVTTADMETEEKFNDSNKSDKSYEYGNTNIDVLELHSTSPSRRTYYLRNRLQYMANEVKLPTKDSKDTTKFIQNHSMEIEHVNEGEESSSSFFECNFKSVEIAVANTAEVTVDKASNADKESESEESFDDLNHLDAISLCGDRNSEDKHNVFELTVSDSSSEPSGDVIETQDSLVIVKPSTLLKNESAERFYQGEGKESKTALVQNHVESIAIDCDSITTPESQACKVPTPSLVCGQQLDASITSGKKKNRKKKKKHSKLHGPQLNIITPLKTPPSSEDIKGWSIEFKDNYQGRAMSHEDVYRESTVIMGASPTLKRFLNLTDSELPNSQSSILEDPLHGGPSNSEFDKECDNLGLIKSTEEKEVGNQVFWNTDVDVATFSRDGPVGIFEDRSKSLLVFDYSSEDSENDDNDEEIMKYNQ